MFSLSALYKRLAVSAQLFLRVYLWKNCLGFLSKHSYFLLSSLSPPCSLYGIYICIIKAAIGKTKNKDGQKKGGWSSRARDASAPSVSV